MYEAHIIVVAALVGLCLLAFVLPCFLRALDKLDEK